MRETFEGRHEVSNRETLRIFGRALRYVAPFKGRFLGKAALTVFGLFPPLLLPWPIKLQIDTYIGGLPVDPGTYPFFLRPLVEPLVGASPGEILFITLAFQLLLVVSIGALGSASNERDHADARISSGRDTATTTENDANYGHSRASGLLGLYEFRFTLRLTHDLNHYYRSRLFERIQALPMTAFDDERIGDAIYRVMYDTPAITQVAYRLLLVPIYAPLGILLVASTLDLAYGTTAMGPIAFAFLPLVFFSTLPFAAIIRRRGEESRMAGATTASTIEEGMSNVLAVQSLGTHERERTRFDNDSLRSFGEYRSYIRVWIFAICAAIVVGVPLIGWIARYGTDLIIDGTLTTGDFAVMTTYFIQVTTYAVILGMLWLRLQGNAAGLNRVFFLMDLPGETDPEGAQPLPPLRNSVILENASFSYEDGTTAARRAGMPVVDGGVVLQARIGAGPGRVGDLVPQIPRLDGFGDLAVGAPDQIPVAVVAHGFDKVVGHADGVVRVLSRDRQIGVAVPVGGIGRDRDFGESLARELDDPVDVAVRNHCPPRPAHGALERGVGRRVQALFRVVAGGRVVARRQHFVEMLFSELGAGDQGGHLLLLDRLPIDVLLDVRVVDIDGHHLRRAPGHRRRNLESGWHTNGSW